MTQPFKARDYQRAIIRHIVENERCNVFAGMGSGKTSSTLTALEGLSMCADPFPALVLAPLRVASTTWPDEVKKWAHLSGLKVGAAIGSAGDRARVLRSRNDIVCINYENAEWLIDWAASEAAWPFKTVIADESTRLKSFRVKQGGKRAQALGKVAHKHVRRWVNLTGTPAPNGLLDLWGQQWFIDAGQRLGRSFSSFQDRWFMVKRKPGQQFGGTVLPLPGAEAEIHRLLAECTITVRAQDFLDLPPLVENVIRVELPEKARRQYRELEREMFLALDHGKNVEAFNAASLTIKCLQLANGALYTDEGADWQEIHTGKLDALESIVEEAAGAPVLCAYHFKSDLARILKRFPFAVELRSEASIRDFSAGAVRLGVGHPASMGHGIDGLQNNCDTLAFFGNWWSLEHRQQMIERIGPTRQVQSGRNRSVTVHSIVAAGTVDETVIARMSSKVSVQDALLEAMKERGT